MAIDLNADIGEGVGEDPARHDEQMLRSVSSANVACGGHAGNTESMTRVCDIAVSLNKAIGAHVSYVDRETFGRGNSDVSPEVLHQQLNEQIHALDEIALKAGSAVTYVKPHGRLYHDACAPDSVEGQVVLDVVLQFREETGRSLSVLGFAGSQLVLRAQELGLRGVNEAYADRSYTAEGWLVDRKEPGALITDANEALIRLKRLLRDHELIAIDGTPLQVRAQSICIHGDTPGAAVMARRLRAAIDVDRVKIAPFAPPPRSHPAPRPT